MRLNLSAHLVLVAVLFVGWSCLSVVHATTATIHTTNASRQFERQGDQNFSHSEETNIVVDENVIHQEIEGFGAALTDSSAYLLFHLPDDIRQRTLNKIFGEDGIGMSMLRVPISASDFALENYTYDNLPEGQTDQDLNHFSISHDEAYIIPLLRMIKGINSNIKLVATPWSAPAWMKTNKNYFGSHDGQQGELDWGYMQTYAAYLTKAMKRYRDNGLTFEYITIQNEPLFAPGNYGGMYMSASQQSVFVNEHLAHEFEQHGISTKVLAYDHNWDHPEYPAEVLRNLNGASQDLVVGTAYHCYGGNVSAQSQTHWEFPSKKIFMTECSGGDWAPDFSGTLVWDLQNLFIGNLNNWGSGGIKWNLALDQHDGPIVGGCTDCRGLLTINTDNHDVKYNVDFYSTGNMSKFIKSGAHRIGVTNNNSDVQVTAVKNPDGGIAVVLVNQSWNQTKVSVGWGHAAVWIDVEPQTVAAVTWKKGENAKKVEGKTNDKKRSTKTH